MAPKDTNYKHVVIGELSQTIFDKLMEDKKFRRRMMIEDFKMAISEFFWSIRNFIGKVFYYVEKEKKRK